MPILTLQSTPDPALLHLFPEPQLCYVMLTISATGSAAPRPINWALVADASRSMRIPIVDERQFRELLRQGGAQETLVDGVPVWQLNRPVPAELRAASQSALDYVARALHSMVERLDNQDRFALVACAEQAILLTRSTPGAERATLVNGIERLKHLNVGEQTDLAQGLALALGELRRGRDGHRAERLLLLTDGFTQRPEVCAQLAASAAAEGVLISTLGLGGEFQEDLLLALADRSGGRAIFLNRPADIPHAIAQELDLARAVAARAVTLTIIPAPNIRLRRVTRIRPALSTLADEPAQAVTLHLGDIATISPTMLLIECLVPPGVEHSRPLADLTMTSEGGPASRHRLLASHQLHPPPLPPAVVDAAAHASIAHLQRRAAEAAARGATVEAIRLLRAIATRLDDLNQHALAELARQEALGLERAGHTNGMTAKELTYATRRLAETRP